MLSTILFVAFPDISASFGESSASTLSWVLNAYTIAFAALLVRAGKVADRLGHRRAFLAGSATFTAASMACGLAPTVWFLIVARVLQGFGAAVRLPSLGGIVLAAMAAFSFSMSFVAMFFGLILFLVEVWEWSILKAGLGVAPGPALAAVLATRFGKLAGQIGQRPLVLAGGLMAALSGLYRVVFLTADVDYVVDFAIPLALSAVAIGLVFPLWPRILYPASTASGGWSWPAA